MPEALDFGPFLLLNDEARARLRAATTRVRFAPGDKLVREDEPADAAYALATGRVRVLAGQDLRTLATLSAPVLVGELAVLSGEPRTATVVATAMCTGVRIPAEALRSALAEDAAFARSCGSTGCSSGGLRRRCRRATRRAASGRRPWRRRPTGPVP